MDSATTSILASATVAILSVICTTVTAYFNQKGAYKIKAAELFFKQKVDAYQSFIDISSNFPANPSKQDVQHMYSAVSRARLLSSQDTENKLAWYCSRLLCNNYSETSIKEIADAHEIALSAMRAEINEYKPNS